MFVGRRILPPDPHDVYTRRTWMGANTSTMMHDRGNTIAVISTTALTTMRIIKTIQAPPWINLPLHLDVRQTFTGYFPILPKRDGKVGNPPNTLKDVEAEYFPIVHNDVGKGGNFPIALSDVEVGNLHTAHPDVGPRTFPHSHTDGIINGSLPDVGLRRAGQGHFTLLHPQVQDPRSFPRRPEQGMKNSFSVSECFSGSASRESRKTTCPALKPGSRGCPAAAYRAMLRLYIRLQDFRQNWFQNWILANILSKIEGEDRSSPTFSGSTSIYT